jgi:uncharacterized membrane protein YfcA
MDALTTLLGHPPEALGLIALATIVGGMAKGITGVGLPIIIISIVVTANLLSPKEAIAYVVVPILITNLWQAVRARGLLEPVKRHAPLIVVFLLFLWLGSLMLAAFDTKVLFVILGACVAVFAATSLWKPRPDPLKPGTERWAGPMAGFLGGLLGGLTTIWGPPLMMYFVLLKLPKDEWVRTVGLVWTAGAVPLTLFYWSNGVLNPSNVWLSAAGCLPGMIGILLGEQIRKWIDEEVFRKVMLVLLFLIGLNLIRRALF